MPVFEYKAKNQKGETVQGTLQMETRDAVIKHLRAEGYFPMRVQPRAVTPPCARVHLPIVAFPVKPRARALFFRHLASTLKAGITPVQALHSCEPRMRDARLRRMIRDWIPRVQAGTPLSVLMRDYPHICPPVTADIVQAGEIGGFLDAALSMIAEDLELEVDLRQQMKWQTLYYKLLLPFILLVPPLPHIITLEQSTPGGYLHRYFHALQRSTLPVIVILLGIWAVAAFGQYIPPLHRILERVKMSLPGWAQFHRVRSRSRFLTNFTFLIKAGVSVSGALRSAAPTCGVKPMENALLAGVPALENGERLADVFEHTGQLSVQDIQGIATGEESGTLIEAMERLAQHYQNEMRAAMKNLTNILKVPLRILVALAVGYAVVVAALNYFDRLFQLGDAMLRDL